MIKNNKLKTVISCVIILLPMLFGIVKWNNLPDNMATHFGIDGTADAFGGKTFVVFVLPLIFLVTNLVCLILTMLDKKQKDQSPKALSMIFWIVPTISLLTSGVMYCVALGREVNLEFFVPVLLGVPFVFMGNYMPKIKQNSTLGIKVSWALRNEENWNKTHRLGGKVMVAGGFVMLLCVFLPIKVSLVVVLSVLAVTVTVPVVYSYLIYRQHKKDGIEYNDISKSKEEKTASKISVAVVCVILIGVAVLMFTGDINVDCEDTSLKINATYWTDIEVDYSELDSVSYRKDLDIGTRTNGFGSARLSTGVFQNEEFGSYTLYAYTGADEFVVVTSNEKTLVIGMKYTKTTKQIYDTVLNKISK